MPEQQMWDSEQVAEYLNLHRSTVIRLAKQGELPGVKVGRQWRFRPEDIRLWFHNKVVDGPGKK